MIIIDKVVGSKSTALTELGPVAYQVDDLVIAGATIIIVLIWNEYVGKKFIRITTVLLQLNVRLVSCCFKQL